jgi:hypothetical protein
MKVWYLKNRYGRGGKFFTSEKAYLTATHKDDTRLLHILEVSSINGIKSGDYYTSLLLERERDEQLSLILDESDNFTRNFAILKRKFEELCPSDDKTTYRSYYTTSSDMGKMLKMVNEKKDFSSIASQNQYKRFLLHAMPPSVEWFESLLKCHNFKELSDVYQMVGGNRRLVVTDERKENFLKAKENLRNSKKKKK